MPDFTPDDLDISPSEFVYACSKREIAELIDELIEEGHLPEERTKDHSTPQNVIFNESLDILSKNRLQLTLEEEDYIVNLAKKFK